MSSHFLQSAYLDAMNKRKATKTKAPLMHTKVHLPTQTAQASKANSNIMISVEDGTKFVKGPLLKIWERFIIFTDSKRQIYGKRTFDAHSSASKTMHLQKILRFCEHFGFLNENLVTPGEIAKLFTQCTQIHSSIREILERMHCEEFLLRKRLVNSEFRLCDFLNFMVRLAVLLFSRPPFEPKDEYKTTLEKIKAFIKHFRLDDLEHVQATLDQAKGENCIKKSKNAFLKKNHGIVRKARSNFEGLNGWENEYMTSLEISDAELEPFIEILLVKRPAYRELSSTFIDVKVQIGKSYRYKISVLNDGGKTKKYQVESKDSHVVSLGKNLPKLS